MYCGWLIFVGLYVDTAQASAPNIVVRDYLSISQNISYLYLVCRVHVVVIALSIKLSQMVIIYLKSFSGAERLGYLI